jgi:ribosomal protein S18 acetylase RimI-like enzyme
MRTSGSRRFGSPRPRSSERSSRRQAARPPIAWVPARDAHVPNVELPQGSPPTAGKVYLVGEKITVPRVYPFGTVGLTSGSPMALDIRPFDPKDEESVVTLWERCGLVRSLNNPHGDIRRKLQVRPDLFLVGLLGGRIVATAMAGYEGHRGWLNYVAVDPDHQRTGLGRKMVSAAEQLLHDAGCPKVNMQVRSSNQAVLEFYRKLGYSVDEVVSLGKRLAHDNPRV